MSGIQDTNLHAPSYSQPQQDGFSYPLRLFLYSHDSVGLGHLRRNLAIAGEVSATFPNAWIQILTGSPCDTQFKLPKNTDLIKIPSISKDSEGRYVTQHFSGSLDNTLNFRGKLILEAFELFKPNFIIMDHQPTGLMGEALDMLRAARKKGVQTIFGLRDIKDSPEAVKRNWSTDDSRWALNECYDRICVYGMQEVFDPCVAYAPFLDKVKQIDFTGFIVPRPKKISKSHLPGMRKKVLVTFGGGSDGAQRAERYLEALATAPANWESHIITGPLMPADARRRIRNRAKKIEPLGSVKVYRFHRHVGALLNQVDAVVSMAGYNSCTEILQSGVPAVLLPRSFPRKEQLIRATRMAELGWANVIPEADPDPHHLFSTVASAVNTPRKVQLKADLNGLKRLCRIIIEQLQTAGLVKNVPQSARPISRAL
jgi:predicted glycosyltransferase